jgi:hypothetical protein
VSCCLVLNGLTACHMMMRHVLQHQIHLGSQLKQVMPYTCVGEAHVLT